MLSLLIAAAAIGAVAPATCTHDHGVRQVADVAPRRLDTLPRADLLLTVYREVDKCPAPVIVRADIGNAAPVSPTRR